MLVWIVSTDRTTRQQAAIEWAIEQAGRPMSPTEIHEAARAQVATISLATVYRGIRRLLEQGRLHPVELPGQPPRYETMRAADHHHHHFHCDRCDRVYDVDGCVPGIQQLAPDGFRVRSHEITLYGMCRECGRAGPSGA